MPPTAPHGPARAGRAALGLTALLWSAAGAAATPTATPAPGADAGLATAATAPTAGAAQRTAKAPSPSIDALRTMVTAPLHEDLDGLLRRGVIRVAVTASKTHFFIDRGQQHGFAYEALREFEAFLRKRHPRRKGGRPLTITFLPVPRDQLLQRLEEGRADLAVANLTITPERSARVAFTTPISSGVREVVVTREGVPAPATPEELSGREVVVRGSSSFREHLAELDARLVAAGKAPVRLTLADEHLETEDLLEMLNAGLIDCTVADEHVAGLWKEIFPSLRVHPGVALSEGGQIAWAVRKDAPGLLAEANAFVPSHRVGTTFGNVLLQRYLGSTSWARRALGAGELERFGQLVQLFQRYGGQYHFDHLMLLAQGFQESGLDHDRKSAVGAIGVMQVMPTTGQSMKVGDIRKLEPNVHAGTKYLRTIIDQNFSGPAITETDRMLLGFAAYNAGPARVQWLRRKAAAQGLDPDVWFGNVETVAAQALGQETVQYVANISKYYLAYRMVENRRRERAAAEATLR